MAAGSSLGPAQNNFTVSPLRADQKQPTPAARPFPDAIRNLTERDQGVPRADRAYRPTLLGHDESARGFLHVFEFSNR